VVGATGIAYSIDLCSFPEEPSIYANKDLFNIQKVTATGLWYSMHCSMVWHRVKICCGYDLPALSAVFSSQSFEPTHILSLCRGILHKALPGTSIKSIPTSYFRLILSISDVIIAQSTFLIVLTSDFSLWSCNNHCVCKDLTWKVKIQFQSYVRQYDTL